MARNIGFLVLLVSTFAASVSNSDDGTASSVNTPASMEVRLASGRVFTGIVDRRTDAQQLWLRFGSKPASITRAIEWDAILEMKQGGKVLSAAEVQQLASGDNGQSAEKTTERIIEPGRIIVRKPYAATSAPTSATSTQPQVALVPSRLQIDCRADNFDGDPENDGLAVELRLVDSRGKSVPFVGSATVHWFGPQARRDSSISPPRGVELGQWTVAVQNDGSGSALLQLPFQRLDPERDPSLWNYSFVQVTLNVPGAGEFSAERDGVRVRRWEPYRDFNQTNFNGPLVQPASRRR